MKAGDKYFMASVDICGCINDRQKAKRALENKNPLSAAAMLRCVAIKSVEALEKIMTIRLSDQSRMIPRDCKNDCGNTATHCGREECKK